MGRQASGAKHSPGKTFLNNVTVLGECFALTHMTHATYASDDSASTSASISARLFISVTHSSMAFASDG